MILAQFWVGGLLCQELQPRAYLPAPIGLNFVGVSYSRNAGGLLFDPSLPIENAQIDADIASVSAGQYFPVLGRTGQALAVLPYARADLSGDVFGISRQAYRSGLGDALFRVSANLYGAPAMTRRDFRKFRQRTLIGASVSALAPTGQYDPNVLVNIGTNRWAFKPEVGISRAIGPWVLEGAFGAWIYTANTNYYGGQTRTQDPLGSAQAHLVRILPRRQWLALDLTFYTGGRSYVGPRVNNDYQGNSRIGGTYGIALTPRQALRFAFFSGATTRVGSDIHSLSVAYQFICSPGK